jgi:DNA polymerase-3 subunit epsilon
VTGWADLPLLAVDTETTGVDPFEARIVEAATATLDPKGRVIDSWSTIVDPGVDIPVQAAEVHGIDNERARLEGQPPHKALEDLAGRLWEHLEAFEMRAPVVVYNGRYDWPLILAEADRHRVEIPVFAPILDPFLLDRMCDRFRRGKRQLTLVAGHYGVDLRPDEAHGALADAIAAGQIMRRLLDRFPDLGDHTLAGLWLHQAHGHEQDRQRFVDWKRQTSDPDFDTPAGWPIPVERGRS